MILESSMERRPGSEVAKTSVSFDLPSPAILKLGWKALPMTSARKLAALLALCAVLVVTTASVLPGHAHANDTARPCDICHSGHLPCLQPAGEIQLHAHMPVIWQHTPDAHQHSLDSTSVIRSPRAPPV